VLRFCRTGDVTFQSKLNNNQYFFDNLLRLLIDSSLLFGKAGMVTKNTPPPASNVPTQRPSVIKESDLRKSTSREADVRILSENQRQTTVFQTRPTPPDPGKK
jgi:hypothetical protein